MGPGRLFWKLFLANTILMVFVLASCVWLIAAEVDRFYADELTQFLRGQAGTVRLMTEPLFSPEHADRLDGLVRQIAGTGPEHVRVTLILKNGKVLADSDWDVATMENHAGRPEVVQALKEGWGQNSRRSATVKDELRYVAVRVGPAEAPIGVARVAMQVRGIGERTGTMEKLIWRTAGVALMAAIVLALGLARLWAGPIQRITATARSLSRGDLSARAHVAGHDELATLSRSLNQMRDNLASQLDTIDIQRRTLESLLAQVHEGVIVAGPNGRIVLINPAAVRILNLEPAGPDSGRPPYEGMAVEACIRQPELQRMLLRDVRDETARKPDESRDGDDPSLREARVQVRRGDTSVSLLARGSTISLPAPNKGGGSDGGGGGPMTGNVVVLTDVSDLARIIQVKTDFAANASHELRTPLSAIRAAVETLKEMDLAQDAVSANHFLQVIDRHSDRMEAMVADLFSLSRIESGAMQWEPAPVRVADFIADVRARFAEPIEAKGLAWSTHVAPGAETFLANSQLLRLVIDNLVDNAIKYTEAGGRVSIVCRTDRDASQGQRTASIEVSDTGCGIPEADLDRVFERFYQVERARTGTVRGTGLGLSIVRHAVTAMKGTVMLHSKVGQGTRVTVAIPQPS